MPYGQDVHIDQALTTLSIAYMNTGLIGDRVAPATPAAKRSDVYFVYGKEAFQRRRDLVRPGSIAPELHRTLSRDSYNAERHAERSFITDDEIHEQDAPLNADVDTNEVLNQALMNNLEYAIVDMVTDPAQVPNNVALSGTSQWSAYDTSTPLLNLKVAKSAVRLGALQEATDLTLSYDVALTLADHPSILDLIRYTDPNNISSSGLPSVVRGLKVNEAGAFVDNAHDGQAPSMATAWGNKALVHYTNPNPGLKSLTFALRFEAPDATTGQRGRTTIRYPEVARHGEWIEVSYTYDIRVIAPLAGYLFTGVQ